MDNRQKNMRWIALMIAAVIVASACGLTGGITDQIDDIASEAQEIATQVQDIATQVDIGDLEATTKALGTQVAEGGIKETMEAIGTEMSEGGSDLQATLEAMATQGSFATGEAPPDIPVIDEDPEAFFANNAVVSYYTAQEFDAVADFYKDQMPANDWVLEDFVETQNTTILTYEKPNRKAIVTLTVNPIDQKTIVAISIQAK
jgi:outer membrane murein-binding lipoprotein Lpp